MENNKITEHADIEEKLKLIFFGESVLFEEPEEEEEEETDADDNEESDETPEGEEDEADDTEESPEEDDSEEEDDADVDDEAEDEVEDPEMSEDKDLDSKIKELFSDTDTPEEDWSVSNPNNVRLAEFKLKAIGIDPSELMTEQEKVLGVPSNILEDRLTTEQKSRYLAKMEKLRKEFPVLSEREKNIVLWNVKTPLSARDSDGNFINIYGDHNLIGEAFEKINEFLESKWGEFWQDSTSAIKFLKNIKIDFSSEKSKITPNLLNKQQFNESYDKGTINFNKIVHETPDSVIEFIRENSQNEEFKKSSIFNSISAGYSSSEITRGSLYPIIKGEVVEEEGEDTEEDEEGEFGDDDFGGDFGGGDLGGGDLGGDEDFGDLDLGDEEGGDEDLDLGDEGDEE